MLYLAFDIAIAAILLLCAWRGAVRGLVLSICGLLAIVVAFTGATFAARAFSPTVARALEPKLTAVIEQRLNVEIQKGDASAINPYTGAVDPSLPDDLPFMDVLNVIKSMGFYEEFIDIVNNAVKNGLTGVAATAAAAVAVSIAKSVAYSVIFFLCFLLIVIVWSILSHTLNLVTRLPGLHVLNKTGGALIGLLKACIFLFLAAALLRTAGNIIPDDEMQKTILLKFFMTTNPALLTHLMFQGGSR